MKKERENPNYHMGKQTGYELINGEYHIAPVYWESFDRLAQQTDGIDMMLKVVTRHASDDLAMIAKQRVELWKRLVEDIGIEMGAGWVYQNGVVKKIEVPKP